MASSTAQHAHGKAYRNAEAIEKLEERVAKLEKLLLRQRPRRKKRSPYEPRKLPLGRIGDPD